MIIKKIDILSSRLIQDVIVRESLEKKLSGTKKLRIKIGMDPTAPDLHLGHAVCLRLLKQFQDAGHTIVFIIGDYTARIGDPSGKSKTRPELDPKEIDKNAKTYFKQVGLILDLKKAEICFNSKWLSKLSFADVVKLAAKFTVARIMERDDFTKRFKAGVDISCHELLYPMMQAYDSVAIKADVEVGGTDQTFNMLAGRELQKKMELPEQDVITVPLLVGLDGEHKMSKSLGNYIGLTDVPEDMYGKVMSIPDRLLMQYFELCTELSSEEIQKTRDELVSSHANPRDMKMRLAKMIVAKYHGDAKAKKAEEQFISVFQKKEMPDDIPEIRAGKKQMDVVELLMIAKFATSKTEARRLIEQKGVKVEGETIVDPVQKIEIGKNGVLVQKGKRFFVKIRE